MNFSDALLWLKDGSKLQRNIWKTRGVYIYLADGVFRLEMRYPSGVSTKWRIEEGDILAEDWKIKSCTFATGGDTPEQ